MKAQFKIDSIGRVTLSYDDLISGERRTREFSCPPNGGYVIEFLRNGATRQVCDHLAAMGSTLTAANRDRLAEVIRREYRKLVAHNRRYA